MRIKRWIFALLFLSISFCLDKSKRIINQPPVFKKPAIETTLQKKPPPSPKPAIAKKPAKVATPTAVKKPTFAEIPVSMNSIGKIPVESVFRDTSAVLAMLHSLKPEFTDGYRVRKFYIPPVEYKLNPKDLILPASLITLGAIAANTSKYKDILPVKRPNPHNRLTPFDDIAQGVVAPSLFIFDIFGEEKHHPVDQFFTMAMAYGIMVIPVRYIKSHYTFPRPYGGNHSFPSGHTAAAFVGAHAIYKEFKDSNSWIAYSGYAMASVVAGARIVHDKHWVSDVLAGAGIAMLSTELAYLIYFPVRNLITGEMNKLLGKYILISPIARPDELGLNLSIRF